MARGSTPGNPHGFRGQPSLWFSCRNASPALGQHTDEVLRDFGLDEAAIAALRAQQAI